MTNCCQFWRACLSFPQLSTLLAWLLTLLDPFFPKKRGGGYIPSLALIVGLLWGQGLADLGGPSAPAHLWRRVHTDAVAFSHFSDFHPFLRLRKMTIFTFFGKKSFLSKLFTLWRTAVHSGLLFSNELFLVVNMRFYKKTRFLLVKYLFITK